MGLTKKSSDLKKRMRDALKGGGEKAIEKQKAIGKLTARERITYLLDEGSFKEMYKKEIWRGQSNLLSIKGRSIPLNEVPSFIIPIAILILFLIMLISLILGKYILAIINFIAMLLPVTLYSARLYILTKNAVRLHDVVKFYLYYLQSCS